ncbi:MAG: M20/M25/M40 family metallo-hydrolase [Williamsia sp.]|nr:M20/M25/M40 family metallo-hydrolase [Williamsia sp.]
MKKTSLPLLLAFLTFLRVNAQQLSPEENAIVDYVNNQLPQTLQLLEKLVNINSGTLNIKGVKKVGGLLQKEFDKIGFATEWVKMPDSIKRAGHLVATTKGQQGKRLFLIGHLDTVFEPDMPANPFKKLTDSTATGQGANDMKGGDVIMLAALQALYQLNLLKNTAITAYFTGDEEKGGNPISVSRADFIERAKQCDAALAFESAQGLHTIATARRGSSSWYLTVTGKQAHSSGIFDRNYGAVYEAARIINTFREQLSQEKYLTFNPAVFAGGTDVAYDFGKVTANIAGKTNIISPNAVVMGDLRFLTEGQKDSARQKMTVITTVYNLPGTSATIRFEDGITSMEPTAGNRKLASLLNSVSTDLGIGPVQEGDPGSRGAGDISYVARYLDCIDGLGASGGGAHAPGEIINLKELPLLVQRAALLIYRLTRQSEP